jgi:S1-C subfamily serine protease
MWDCMDSRSLATLDLYLRNGVRFDRFFTFKSDLGVITDDVLAGPLVCSVAEGSFAAQAGIEPGDIIVQVGAAPVFTRSDLWLFTREHAAGEEVDVTYVRGGELRTASAALSPPM